MVNKTFADLDNSEKDLFKHNICEEVLNTSTGQRTLRFTNMFIERVIEVIPDVERHFLKLNHQEGRMYETLEQAYAEGMTTYMAVFETAVWSAIERLYDKQFTLQQGNDKVMAAVRNAGCTEGLLMLDELNSRSLVFHAGCSLLSAIDYAHDDRFMNSLRAILGVELPDWF